jgi:hypothetical protein
MRRVSVLVVAAALVFTTGTTLYAGDRAFRAGQKVNGFMNRVDRAVQNGLNRNPRVGNGITNGINHAGDFTTGMANPNATPEEREIGRNAAQFLLNPSHQESQRALDNLTRPFAR